MVNLPFASVLIDCSLASKTLSPSRSKKTSALLNGPLTILPVTGFPAGSNVPRQADKATNAIGLIVRNLLKPISPSQKKTVTVTSTL